MNHSQFLSHSKSRQSSQLALVKVDTNLKQKTAKNAGASLEKLLKDTTRR